jgi:hypothetical protein
MYSREVFHVPLLECNDQNNIIPLLLLLVRVRVGHPACPAQLCVYMTIMLHIERIYIMAHGAYHIRYMTCACAC